MQNYDIQYANSDIAVMAENYTLPEIDPDARHTKQLLLLCGIAGLVSVILYGLTGDRMIAGAPFGLVVLLCCLIHTPLAFVVLYSILPLEMVFRFSPFFSASKVMGLVVVISFVLTRLGRSFGLPQIVKWMLVFGLFCLFSTTWAIANTFSLIGVATILMHIGLIVLLVNTIKSVEMLRLIFWGLVITSAMGAGLLFQGIGMAWDVGEGGRFAFEDMNPNILAAQFSVSIIAGLYLFSNAHFWGKLVLSGPILITGAGLLYTQSRSSLLALIMAICIAFLLMLKGPNKFIYLALLLMFCATTYGGLRFIMATELLGHQATQRLRATQRDLGQSGRLDFWKMGAQFFMERPLHGYGYRNFPIRYGGGLMGVDAHNSYVSLAVELGIIGMFMFLMIHYLILKRSLATQIPPLRWLCLALLFFTIFNGMTHTTYNQKEFWYAFGYIIVISQLFSRNPSQDYPLDNIHDQPLSDYYPDYDRSAYINDANTGDYT